MPVDRVFSVKGTGTVAARRVALRRHRHRDYLIDIGRLERIGITLICYDREPEDPETHMVRHDVFRNGRHADRIGGLLRYGIPDFKMEKSHIDRRVAQMQAEGVKFLMDPTSAAYLSGSSVDFDDGLHGKGFEIRNPNAQSTCGCGKSFES
mgnify:CR=1 FL=1